MQQPLDVPLHIADPPSRGSIGVLLSFCGHACAQMIHAFLNRHQVNHPQLAFEEPYLSKGYITTPGQMAAMINWLNPPRRYAVYTSDDPNSVLEKARDSVLAGWPAVALVNEGDHWVVVRGFTGLDNDPRIHIRDPKPAAGGIQHAPDDECAYTSLEFNGLVDESFPLTAWCQYHFTKCDIGEEKGHWNRNIYYDKWVVIAAELNGGGLLPLNDPVG